MKRRRTTAVLLCTALLLAAVTTGAAVASGPHEDRPEREVTAVAVASPAGPDHDEV
ncbi:hypothetical protein GCM10009535_27840 [Streptomyces thermocarboxydovorans]|uniref:Uncharacterized protein n=1 Tax=Streptomyces thermocarboxydovorans TaxID=59298 RepID=A0ABN1HH12_9ACTN